MYYTSSQYSFWSLQLVDSSYYTLLGQQHTEAAQIATRVSGVAPILQHTLISLLYTSQVHQKTSNIKRQLRSQDMIDTASFFYSIPIATYKAGLEIHRRTVAVAMQQRRFRDHLDNSSLDEIANGQHHKLTGEISGTIKDSNCM